MKTLCRVILWVMMTSAAFAIDQCHICEPGTFCFAEELTHCPANATSPAGSFDLKNCSCVAGFYGGDSCEFCGVGFYCSGGSAREACPANTETLTEYSSGVEECECTPGYYMQDNACKQCPQGKFKTRAGNVEGCDNCPANTYSTTFASISSLTCLSCPRYSSSEQGSTAANMCICDTGFHPDTPSTCMSCPLGKYGAGGGCVSCPFAMYNLLLNSTSCQDCPSNSNTSQRGAISPSECRCLSGYVSTSSTTSRDCTACSVGTYARDGRCLASPLNTYVDTGAASTYKDCPNNSATEGNASTSIDSCHCNAGFERAGVQCQRCAAGKFKGSHGNASCSLCEAGQFNVLDGAIECTACPPNTFQAEPGSSTCTACPPNSVSGDGSWAQHMCLCQPGFSGNNDSCVACALGFYKASTANHACAHCGDGFSTLSRKSLTRDACRECPRNYYAAYNLSDYVCQACPDHSVSIPGSPSLVNCSCGYGYGYEEDECVACTEGKYKNRLGNTPCIACPSGKQGTADRPSRISEYDSCSECESGKYEQQNVCFFCPGNSSANSGSVSVDNCTCQAGYAYAEQCVPCVAGKYKSSIANDANCTDCPRGKYSALPAQRICTPCPENTSSPVRSSSLSSCVCDKERGFVGNEHACRLCAPGSYLENNSCHKCTANHFYPVQPPPFTANRCQRCPDQMHSASGSYGVDDCVCRPGFMRNSSSSCVPCRNNSYCPSQTVEISCPENTASPSASHLLSQCRCVAGHFGGPVCVLCEKDHFCPGGSNQTACKANSTTQGHRGQRSESACVCNLGFFEDATDGQCHACPADSYCFNDSFIKCPQNSTAFSRMGVVSDCRCSYGLYMNNSACLACDAGMLCLGGQHEAVACSTGAIVREGQCVCDDGMFCKSPTPSRQTPENGCVAPTHCQICPEGSRCGSNIKRDCQARSSTPVGSDLATTCVCDDGWYKSGGVCTQCPEDHFCSGDNISSCRAWDSNLQTLGGLQFEKTQCVCANGFFRLNHNDTCKKCPRNHYCPNEITQQLPNVVPCLENEYTDGEGFQKRTDCLCDAGSKLVADGPTMRCLPCTEGERCVDGVVQEAFCHLGYRVATDDHSACVCMSGFFESSGKNCRPCRMGTVKPELGNQECRACPAGSFSYNSTTCLPCAVDRESDAGSHECSCKEPLVDDNGECRPCNVGYSYRKYDTKATCDPCHDFSTSEPSSSDQARRKCFCKPGYKAVGEDHCEPCPENTYWRQSGCTPCGAGLLSPEASVSQENCTCATCTAMVWNGVYACFSSCAENVTNCTACEVGKFKRAYSDEGNENKCERCGVNRYAEVQGSASCSFCPTTRMTTDKESVSAYDCKCRPGFYETIDDPRQNCSHCEIGSYKAEFGNGDCYPCPEGSFADFVGMTQCKPCSVYSEMKHANTTLQANGSTSVSDCTCDMGYFSDSTQYSGNAECLQCARGSFKHTKGYSACFFCGNIEPRYNVHLLNMYGGDQTGAISHTHCKECPPKSGQNDILIPNTLVMDGIEDCLCFAGYEPNPSSNVTDGCVLCEKYKFKVGFSNDDCRYCEDNTYFVNRVSECRECLLETVDGSQTHSYALNSNFTNTKWGIDESDCVCGDGYYRKDQECLACEIGHYRNDIMTAPRYSCIECPRDTYTEELASAVCKNCPSNAFTAANASEKRGDCLCRAGFEWSGATCKACPPGKFKSFDDEATKRYVCQVCPDGTFSNSNASIVCQECGENKHSTAPRDSRENCECDAGFGGPDCTACNVSFYSAGGTAEDPLKHCESCLEGKTTYTEASKRKDQCVCRPGHGMDPETTDTVNDDCRLCGNGLYSIGFANIACVHCGTNGVTEPEVGATDFDACMCNHEIGFFETQ